ncbi:MAG: HDOD domain-containing protein, partial [Gammaproteobacteria bacterium]
MDTTLEKRSAEEWAAWLLEQDLPSTNRTAPDLLAELDGTPRTFQAMSDEIQEDPVLALKLLARANTALDAKETLVKTLSQALSLLGVDFLRNLLSSVRIEDSESSPSARRFHWRMGRSFVAAHIARALAQYHFAKQADELFWAALFRSIPAWYLARMLDDQDHPPAHLRGRQRAQWQREHWGADEESIWRHMIPRLGMPERVTRAQLPAERETLRHWARLERLCPSEGTPPRPEDRTLRMLIQSPDTLVILAI